MNEQVVLDAPELQPAMPQGSPLVVLVGGTPVVGNTPVSPDDVTGPDPDPEPELVPIASTSPAFGPQPATTPSNTNDIQDRQRGGEE